MKIANLKDLMYTLDTFEVCGINTLSDVVNRVHTDALDNAAHTDGVTVHGEGGYGYTEEFYIAWYASIQTALACFDYVTDECCDWFLAQGVKF